LRESPGCLPLLDSLESGPSQQADGAHDECPHYDLVLITVPLEAHRDDIVLLSVVAEVDALT
jgi:hypothetical protein